VATDTTEREVDVSREAMFAARLKQIDDALTRLSSGTYGHCIVCNTAIPDERLRAIPDTPFCAKDAQREQARAQ
jgi:RNA polymerase-binding transcription factor DksA